MIGPANAASCPDGSKPQQGKCVTVVGTPQCPADTQTSGNTCTKTYSSSGTAARQDCKRLGGNFDAQTKTCTNIPKQCSEGTLSSDGTQCVTFTKPGNP